MRWPLVPRWGCQALELCLLGTKGLASVLQISVSGIFYAPGFNNHQAFLGHILLNSMEGLEPLLEFNAVLVLIAGM